MGQGTGLIKHNSIRLGQGFQILASLDGDVVGTAFTHSRQHGQRHGKFKCAREIDHQNRDCAGYVAGERIGHDRTSQTPRHQAIRQLQGVVFRAGLELFGLFDHRYDLIVTTGTIHGVCSKNAFAFLNNSTCINCHTRNLAYRHRLTGQGRLVDHGFALDHGAIQRHHVARTHNDLVPRLQLAMFYKINFLQKSLFASITYFTLFTSAFWIKMCRLVLFLKILCSTFHHFAQFQPTAAVRFAAL